MTTKNKSKSSIFINKTKKKQSLVRSLFIFRRDLRLQDNTALAECIRQSNIIHFLFIFAPEQVANNSYKSYNAIQFMIKSLQELSQELNGKLHFMYGTNVDVLQQCIKKWNINHFFCNADFSPYAIKRDAEIKTLMDTNNIKTIFCEDYTLFGLGLIGTDDADAETKQYKKFTPFYDHFIAKDIKKPIHCNLSSHQIAPLSSFAKSLTSICKKIFGNVSWNDNIAVIGGRKNGLELLEKSTKEQHHYDTERDTFSYETSKLSAHLKFGTISVREVYWKWHNTFGKKSGILRELFWREFFARALFHFPDVLSKSYQPKFKHIKWKGLEQDFNKWKEGKTGFPIVDAGMRQMNATGYMHNRARMIVASFLVKTLLIDWTKGEQYFATKLVDYDVASNNGGWQGISGTGIDMKPYFRDMNPWIQAKKFDKETKYIKQWVEELRDISAKDILNWNEKWQEHKGVYYEPIADYIEQKKKMLQMYREAI